MSFVIWGGINGVYIICGEVLRPLRNKVISLLHLNRETLGHRLLSTLGTFFLIDFSWIFFRASYFRGAMDILKSIFTVRNPWILFDGSLYSCGLDEQNFRLMILGIVILLVADICKYKKIKIRDIISKQDYWFRWLFFSLAVCGILVFGIWGSNYDAGAFIYFQF